MREYELLKRLGSEYRVHLIAISKTYEDDCANVRNLDGICDRVSVFRAEPAGPPDPEIPYQVLRHRSAAATRAVARACRHADLLHVEGFYLMQHVPPERKIPLLLIEQNIEYVLWRQRTETAASAEERDINLAQYLKTLESEIETWKRSDLCAAVTEDDRGIMHAASPGLDVRVVPDGADHLARIPDAPLDRSISAVYVANFAYQPNLDGALFLAREIWPRVRSRLPRATLALVGNDPPPEVLALQRKGIVVTGRVARVEPYLHAARAVVCPLRIGGGVKVKVLEALSAGKALVTTSVGLQGLPAAAGACLVEDEPARFARAIVRVVRYPKVRARLEAASREFARSLPTWDDAAARLTECYRELLRTDVVDLPVTERRTTRPKTRTKKLAKPIDSFAK